METKQIVVVILTLSLAQPQLACAQAQIRQLDRHAPAVDVLLTYARDKKVPIGIVADEEGSLTKAYPEPPAEDPDWLRDFVAQLPNYSLEKAGEVTVIRPKVERKSTSAMLNVKIPEFVTGPATVSALSMRLWMELQLKVSSPRPTGFSGVVHSQDSRVTAGLRLRDATVEQILNAIILTTREAAWIVFAPPEQLQGAEESRLWGIVHFDQGPPDAPVSTLCCFERQYLRTAGSPPVESATPKR